MGSKRLDGKRVLVTGASRGIGAAVAHRAAAEGADVAIVARTVNAEDAYLPGTLGDTADRLRTFGGRVVVVQADLADERDRERVVREAEDGLGGQIDVLVNNAAVALYGTVADYEFKRMRLMYELNCVAPLHLAQHVIPAMAERGEGWIVNISSGTARHWDGPRSAWAGPEPRPPPTAPPRPRSTGSAMASPPSSTEPESASTPSNRAPRS